jgi:hypothetical protein
MNPEKYYGEIINRVYRTIIISFDIEKQVVKLIGAPPNYGASNFLYLSENTILLQAIDLSRDRLHGIRSYLNQPFHLFAVQLEEQPVFHYLSSKIHLFPAGFPISDDKARIFSLRFPDGFGGHSGPLHPWTAILHLNDYSISDIQESENLIGVTSLPNKPFIDSTTIILNTEEKCFLIPLKLNLETFETESLTFSHIPENTSVIIDDYLSGSTLLRIVSLISIPSFTLLISNRLTYLTQEFTYSQLSSKILHFENNTDAILLLASSAPKTFIIHVHGGPCGMASTYFNGIGLIFALFDYSMAFVNYGEKAGYPFEMVRSIVGKCAVVIVEDTVSVIRKIKSEYFPDQIGIFGISHDGILSLHVASQN